MNGRDAELAALAAAGERGAVRELLERHGPDVRRALEGQIPPKWRGVLSIDDVMQQAYADAFVGIARFSAAPESSFGGWLMAIARCTLIDALRMLEADKRGGGMARVGLMIGSESRTRLMELAGTDLTPSRDAARHEAVGALRDALEHLPGAQRTVVELYDLQGKGAKEVAAVLGRSEGAVYLLRVRAHRRLCEILGSSSKFLTRTA